MRCGPCCASDRPTGLTLLEATEAEHAAIDQVIEAIEAALAEPEDELDRLGDLTDSLVTGLTGHLRHEEEHVLPLIQAVVTQEQWNRFAAAFRRESNLGPQPVHVRADINAEGPV